MLKNAILQGNLLCIAFSAWLEKIWHPFFILTTSQSRCFTIKMGCLPFFAKKPCQMPKKATFLPLTPFLVCNYVHTPFLSILRFWCVIISIHRFWCVRTPFLVCIMFFAGKCGIFSILSNLAIGWHILHVGGATPFNFSLNFFQELSATILHSTICILTIHINENLKECTGKLIVEILK